MKQRKSKYSVETFKRAKPAKGGKRVIAYAFDPLLLNTSTWFDNCIEPLMIFDTCNDAHKFFGYEIRGYVQSIPGLLSKQFENYGKYIRCDEFPLIKLIENSNKYKFNKIKSFYCRNKRAEGEMFGKDKYPLITFIMVDGVAFKQLN